jgi:predicted nuclease of predicted toxin-antitoxin system
MIIWLDAQRPPSLASWLKETFGVDAVTVRDLGLRDADDEDIFDAARAATDVVVLTKDSDFIDLAIRLGSPPRILWLTCGNVTNRRLRALLGEVFPQALDCLSNGENIVEISERA